MAREGGMEEKGMMGNMAPGILRRDELVVEVVVEVMPVYAGGGFTGERGRERE